MFLEVLESVDLNKSGTRDLRISHVTEGNEKQNGYYVYMMDINRGQISSFDSNEFATHSAMGVICVGKRFKALSGAKRYFSRKKKEILG